MSKVQHALRDKIAWRVKEIARIKLICDTTSVIEETRFDKWMQRIDKFQCEIEDLEIDLKYSGEL